MLVFAAFWMKIKNKDSVLRILRKNPNRIKESINLTSHYTSTYYSFPRKTKPMKITSRDQENYVHGNSMFEINCFQKEKKLFENNWNNF